MTPEQVTKKYNQTMKRLSSPSKSTEGQVLKLFTGIGKKTKPAGPSNVAERFDKALKGVPLTAKQRTSMYNSADKIYQNFLKDSEKGLDRAEKKIKKATTDPSIKVNKIKAKNIIPRARARIASLKVSDPEVGQEGPYKDKTDFQSDEGKIIGKAARYQRRMAKKDIKRNMGGPVRGVGQATRGFGNAKYSNKMY
tara:strand:- start:83 stop:667 length:585 start_codon:yes stop_codon:yes gene_type:complete